MIGNYQEARSVLSNYELAVETIHPIHDEGDKAVWKVGTTSGPKCLKRLPLGRGKALFVLSAQRYLAESGGRVPPLDMTREGHFLVEEQERVYAVSTWFEGCRRPNMRSAAEVQALFEALAVFHRASGGFVPIPGSLVSTKLGRWPHHYDKMLQELESWKQVALASPGDMAMKTYLDCVDRFIAQGRRAQSLLEQSTYDAWVAQVEDEKCLSHQDYGDTNTLIDARGTVSTIDMDSVTYDLPVRDLRKMINKMMKDHGTWDVRIVHHVLSWYVPVHPLDRDERRVLFIDLFFPHLFHSAAKNCFRKNKRSAGELQSRARLESAKEPILTALINSDTA